MCEEKRCLMCRKIKSVDYFYFRKDAGDYHAQCKECLTGKHTPIKYRTYFAGKVEFDFDEIPTLQEIKMDHFLQVARNHNYKTTKICKILGISTRAYYRYIDKLDKRYEK